MSGLSPAAASSLLRIGDPRGVNYGGPQGSSIGPRGSDRSIAVGTNAATNVSVVVQGSGNQVSLSNIGTDGSVIVNANSGQQSFNASTLRGSPTLDHSSTGAANASSIDAFVRNGGFNQGTYAGGGGGVADARRRNDR